MKLLGSVLVVLAVLFAQVGNVAAAPQAQDTTPITGTIVSIVTEMDAEGTTIVVVTLEGGQTVRMSVETAVTLGLVTLDPTTNEPVVDETKVGQIVVIPEEEEDVHPIAEILGDYFEVDPSVVNEYHEDGFGFGVIAQAMWMSEGLNGDASAAGLILEAKRSGNYEAFTLPDGSSPTNWGQFKKALKENKDKHNLGVIVSGHADDDDAEDKGNDKDKKDKKEKKDKNKNKP